MKLSSKHIAPFVLLATGILLALLQWISNGVNGETDSIAHFQLARYAFKYPENFLNHWGKPLFTILAAPLAQFGYNGAIAFNLVCGLLSGWFTYKIAWRLGYKNAWLAIVLVVFTPVYLITMYSSLTEILFSLVLVIAIYLFVNERFMWSAIVISFIPFARTEGLMFVILFIPALMWLKQYRTLLFLFTGLLLFSFAGWPLYKDPFWFFTKMPYAFNNSGAGLYGSGSFWFYTVKMKSILNLPLISLFAGGLLACLFNLKETSRNSFTIKFVVLYFLVIPSFFGFVLVHSFFWWRGLMGVLASTRFIACVLPLSALISLAGFDLITGVIKNNSIRIVVSAIIIAWVIYTPSRYEQLPVKTGKNFAVMLQLTSWLKTTPYASHKAYFSDPMFPFYMNLDPFDIKKCSRVYSFENIDPSALLHPGDLLIWDAQFAGYEGQLPFESLAKNNKLQLLKVFTPLREFAIIGGEKYKLAVYVMTTGNTCRTSYFQFNHAGISSLLVLNQKIYSVTKERPSGEPTCPVILLRSPGSLFENKN